MFGSRSDPSTPAQGTTPLTRSRASSSTRHQDDSYMDDALNAENPGVNDIMMGAAALPPENPVGFGANLVADARERENIFAAETTAPTAPVLAPTVPIVWTKRTFESRESYKHDLQKKPVDQSLKKQCRMSSETSSHQPPFRTSFTMRRRTVKSASLMKAE